MRIAIVNDLPIATLALRRVLAGSDHQVAWVAADGASAVAECLNDRPDLILMDLLMPGMNGAEATRRIMSQTPCAILLVTASVADNVSDVFEAMGHGALDAVNTPMLGGVGEEGASILLDKIAVIGNLIGANHVHRRRALVAIGASAGGPGAIATILHGLPETLPATLVVVQHVDPQFVPGMTQWFGGQTALRVRPVAENDEPCIGVVHVATTHDHLVLKPDGRFGYTAEPSDYVYRPSVDVMFESIARHWPRDVVGVLLSGMGRDGAVGLKRLRDGGALTIAQNRESSAVWGMPKAAIDIGAASEILPLDRIAPRLVEFISSSKRKRPVP
jgi:two-component system, chemotaxis family, response regulator WspF